MCKCPNPDKLALNCILFLMREKDTQTAESENVENDHLVNFKSI